MSVITITNLHDGVNIKSDPSAISEGAVADIVGFDITKEGVLETSKGVGPNDIDAFLPTNVECFRIEYIGLNRYVLATTAIGLYSNGVLVKGGFSGKFASVSFINNIFLCNGHLAIRFDGTSLLPMGYHSSNICSNYCPWNISVY